MDNGIWFFIMVFLFTFSGLAVGGISGGIIKVFFKNKLFLLYALCGGILIGLMLFEIIPETWEKNNKVGVILGVIIGIFLLSIIESLLKNRKKFIINHKKSVFLFLTIGIAIHNFPTGLALGMGSLEKLELSPLVIAIFFHHIPEGIALAFTFVDQEMNILIYWQILIIISIILGIGAFVGNTLVDNFEKLYSVFIGTSIGTIGLVTVTEILGKAKNNLPLITFLIPTLFGMVIVKLYFFVFL
ncbi:ZIP family metal transporter [Fictibacillus aquaticus]|uniref:Uncharacterized protein n=1 Tax=Fictibacillus aquaticus TaxID=2021314 RepID=A0A235F5Y5_9BACL|nr:ZIP family metal transporter [Fictibacillus aquaticus]OYD56115.1 hypothetical protein CGZ90_19255 [Fictibacillus aquaticus]